MSDIVVRSPYQENIDPAVRAAQARVFDALGLNLEQVHTGDQTHADWLDEEAQGCDRELIVFCDIDAFPITRRAFDLAIAQAQSGHIVGLAQVANHRDPRKIYAGPMFLAFRKDVFEHLGKPSLNPLANGDAAQALTDEALAQGVPVDLLYPSSVIEPRWALADRGVFGIGTFYAENGFFHLFRSRDPKNVPLFTAVAADAVKGKLRFSHYLDLMAKPEPESMLDRLRKRFR
jgi:hypothetical protein